MSEWEIMPELPQLVVPAPECGHCGNDVQMDGDSAWCENCRVAWDRIFDGDVSEPDPDCEESTDVRCEIVDKPIAGPGMTLIHGPCILPSGHEGEHLCPYRREWATAYVTAGLADVEIGRQGNG